MEEIFGFLSDFADSAFSGWRGKVGLVSFGVAISFVAILAHSQRYLPTGPQELWRTERFWFVITPCTLLAGYLLITNCRKGKSSVKKHAGSQIEAKK